MSHWSWSELFWFESPEEIGELVLYRQYKDSDGNIVYHSVTPADVLETANKIWLQVFSHADKLWRRGD